MKKIISLIKQKWADYLLETIVIMIGILSAFGLNNWKDNQRERADELNILEELARDLEEDGQIVGDIRDRRVKTQESLDRMMDYLRVDQPDKIVKDIFEVDVARLLTLERYFPIRSSYEVYKSKGSHLSNPELRSELARYYEYEQDWVGSSIKDIEDAFLTKFSLIIEKYEITEVEYGEYIRFKDYGDSDLLEEIRVLVMGFQNNHRGSLQKIEVFVGKNDELLKLVESEISELK